MKQSANGIKKDYEDKPDNSEGVISAHVLQRAIRICKEKKKMQKQNELLIKKKKQKKKNNTQKIHEDQKEQQKGKMKRFILILNVIKL